MVKLSPMPSPEKRPRGSYTARIKIPAELREVYASKFGQRWSIKKTWPKTLTQAQANEKCEAWIKATTARFDALRAANAGHLATLDHRQIHALVGQWYMEFVHEHEIRPGDPAGWQMALEQFGDALTMAGGLAERDHDDLLRDPDVLAAIRNDWPVPEDPLIDRGFSIARATQADQWLMDHGYALTRESRDAFLDALAPRYADALALLIRRARGDFSRDPIAETFPTLTPIKAISGKELSIRALFDQWIEATKPAAGTISRWRGVIDVAAKRWPDLRRITDADAREWVKGLVTDDRSAHTVNATWRTALKTLCNWSIDQGFLTNNPFTRAKVVVPRKIATRESKAFTAEEARTILTAALAVETRTPLLALLAAKRWLPWLCAYSGARAGEIAQLRGQDVTLRDGVWAMLLTPEAGTIKNRKPRSVPLHEHLIAQGFLEFVKSRGKGPLFFDPRPMDAEIARPPSAKIVKQAGEWVRSLGITDEEIRPNHAWRHLFKLIAERAGIPERLSDVITGHAPASIGRAYGQPTLIDLAREMAKFPRYEV